MSDIKLLEEVMNHVEQAAYLGEKIDNASLRAYVEDTLRQAYEDIQVEVLSKLDNHPYV
jgi:hypothetical protein